MEDAVSLLPPEIAAMPVKELHRSTKNMLTQALDPPHRGYNKDGVMQDWTGLAELMNLDPQEIEYYENNTNSSDSKTMGILKKWSFSSNASTLGKLWEFIEQLERFDILNDDKLLTRFKRDFGAYKQRQENQIEEDRRYQEEIDRQTRPVQVPLVDSNHQDLIQQRDRDYNEFQHIVVDDVLHPDKPQVIYDAFVSFCHSDFAFVQEMLDMVEAKHGLRLCVNARDLLPGASTLFVTAKLIADRCRKVILIMSEDFVNSPECEFQVKVALSLSPGAKQKILIPIMYRPCKIPLVLQHVCTVDYTKVDLADWFWTRLSASLRESYVSVTRQLSFDESVKLQAVEMELLPDGDDNPTHLLQSSFSGQIRPPKIAEPRFKGQAHRQNRSKKKSRDDGSRSLESSTEDKSGFEFVSGEYREHNLGSAAPVPMTRTKPAKMGSPRGSSSYTTQQPGKSRSEKNSPRPFQHGAIKHPSFSAASLPNSTPNIRHNSPMSHGGSWKTDSSDSFTSSQESERGVYYSGSSVESMHGSNAPIAPPRSKRKTTQRDKNSHSYGRPHRESGGSLESSMECGMGSVDSIGASKKDIKLPFPVSGGSLKSGGWNNDWSSSGDPVHFPPNYQPAVGDNRMLGESQLWSYDDDDEEDLDKYRYGGSLRSLRSTDIRLPPMDLPTNSQGREKYKNGSHSDRSKLGSDEYDHDEHALASLSMSTIEFHYQSTNTGPTPASDDSSVPINITLPPPTLEGYTDNAMSMSPGPGGIREFFPSTDSSTGSGQRKNNKSESRA